MPWVHLRLAAAYSLKEDTAHAAAELSEAQRTEHRGHDLSITRLKGEPWPSANIGALFETTYYAGLRKAGVREE